MTLQLEVLEDPTHSGPYLVEVREYPAADDSKTVYRVYDFDGDRGAWFNTFHPAWAGAVVHGWYGPVEDWELEALEDPSELGYYVVLLQPYPTGTPTARKYAVCIWRRGQWFDQYGWAPQYGNVLGWLGPFPMLKTEHPWVKQHEKQEAEDIGL